MEHNLSILFISSDHDLISKIDTRLYPHTYIISAANLNFIENIGDMIDQPIDIIIADMRLNYADISKGLIKIQTQWPLITQLAIYDTDNIESIVELWCFGNIQNFIPYNSIDSSLNSIVMSAIDIQLHKKTYNKNKNDHLQYIYKYHMMYESLPVGLINIDESGLIVEMNEFSCSLLNLKAPLVGHTVSSLPNKILNCFNYLNTASSIKTRMNIDNKDISVTLKKLNDYIFPGYVVALHET